jgi:hypothetical protein
MARATQLPTDRPATRSFAPLFIAALAGVLMPGLAASDPKCNRLLKMTGAVTVSLVRE